MRPFWAMFVRAHRGNTLTAGIVALSAFVVEVELRTGNTPAVRLGCVAAVGALAALGALWSPMPEGRPRTFHEVLLTVAALAAAGCAAHVADLLGADVDGRPAALAVALVAGIGGGVALLLARLRGATLVLGIGWALLLAAAMAAVGALWPGEDPMRGVRWLLLAAILGLTAGVALRIDRQYPRAVALADVVAGAVLLLAATFLVELVPGGPERLGVPRTGAGAGWGWELVLLVAGFGLVGLGATLREQGPGWFGALSLVAALAVVAQGADGLAGWPLVLLAAGIALVAVALRPVRHRVPPAAEPDPLAGPPPDPLPLPPRPRLVPRPTDDDAD